MSDWPTDAERVERDRETMPREVGDGPFVLVTHAFVLKAGKVEPFSMTYRFKTEAQRDVFASWAKEKGSVVEVSQ